MTENSRQQVKTDLNERQTNRYLNISNSLYANFDYLKKLFEYNNHHNAENGSFNETLLKELFERELSLNFKVTSGFVINKAGNISTQFDLIIYESHTPLVFDKGGISIVPIEGVKAIIEIKTSVTGLKTQSNNSLEQVISKLVIQNKEIYKENKDIVFGVFGYRLCVEINVSQLKRIFGIKEYEDVNFCISLDKKIFINSSISSNKYHKDEGENIAGRKYKHQLYKFEDDLSTGYFFDNIRYKVSQYDNYYLDYLFPKSGKGSSRIQSLN